MFSASAMFASTIRFCAVTPGGTGAQEQLCAGEVVAPARRSLYRSGIRSSASLTVAPAASINSTLASASACSTSNVCETRRVSGTLASRRDSTVVGIERGGFGGPIAEYSNTGLSGSPYRGHIVHLMARRPSNSATFAFARSFPNTAAVPGGDADRSRALHGTTATRTSTTPADRAARVSTTVITNAARARSRSRLTFP